ncbi:hypothetical protein MATL_G00220280 [Megalops atlanticus]|uniref:Ig-like domain-containing protein n=1 Tax=Megalops atlanticus TaxID=7932 RepID=A0A9D3PHW7_MEGAT|nr:hypothetical protein MATL_G00220280 [Megalops atlanticus]
MDSFCITVIVVLCVQSSLQDRVPGAAVLGSVRRGDNITLHCDVKNDMDTVWFRQCFDSNHSKTRFSAHETLSNPLPRVPPLAFAPPSAPPVGCAQSCPLLVSVCVVSALLCSACGYRLGMCQALRRSQKNETHREQEEGLLEGAKDLHAHTEVRYFRL